MNLKLVILVALAALLLAGCNKGGQQQAANTDAGKTGAAPATAANDEQPSLAGTSLTLAGGTAVTVEPVADVDKDPAGHSGLVAIEGRVLQVFAEKSAFTMTDYGVEVCLDKPGCTS